LCAPAEICRPVSIPVDSVVTVSPIGSYDAGEVCFMADTAGRYEIAVEAHSDCGNASCTFVVNVDMNTPPIADDPTSPLDTFLCVSDEICYQFTGNDIDGGTLIWSKLSGDGAGAEIGVLMLPHQVITLSLQYWQIHAEYPTQPV